MYFLPHSFSHSIEQGWSTTENDILEEILTDVHITFLNWIVAVLMNTFYVEASILWMEHYFSRSEPLVSDQDFSSIRKLIILFTWMGSFCLFHWLFKVINNITHFLFNVPYNFKFSICCEWVASFIQDLL